MKLSGKCDPITGAYNNIPRKKFTNCKIDDATRKSEEWITKLELIRGYPRKMDANTDNSEVMTHIL